MQSQQTGQPYPSQQREYSWLLFSGFLAALLLWLGALALLIYFTPLPHFFPQHSSLAFGVTLALFGWPLLLLATLLLLVGTLLLVQPQAVRRMVEGTKTPPREQAIYCLWLGVLPAAVYLLFFLGALFNFPPLVALLIVMASSCTSITPVLTVRYMRRARQP